MPKIEDLCPCGIAFKQQSDVKPQEATRRDKQDPQRVCYSSKKAYASKIADYLRAKSKEVEAFKRAKKAYALNRDRELLFTLCQGSAHPKRAGRGNRLVDIGRYK